MTRSYLINGFRGVSGALRRNLNIGSGLFDAGLVWACGVLYHLRGIYEIASSTRLTYIPLPEATPESELDALAAVYAFVLEAHASKKAATPSGQADDVRKDTNAHTKDSIPR